MPQNAATKLDYEALIPEKARRAEIAGTPFDLLGVDEVERALRERQADAPFEYVVTPNVDHVVRNHRLGLRTLYDGAWISVCDSRVLARLARLLNVRFPSVITGSDLTFRLVDQFLERGDHITVIGGDLENIRKLKEQLKRVTLHHYNPPMGFIRSEQEVGKAIDYVLNHPSRFVLLAVGSPQQEMLALRIKQSGGKGIGLCIGASILFITGAETRAPRWVQAISMEWFYRLIQNPKRLGRRYLVENPVIFYLVFRERFKMWQGKKR